MKLNFYFTTYEGALEARQDGGICMISQWGEEIHVSGYVNEKPFDVGKFPDIYVALEKANEWWNENVKDV